MVIPYERLITLSGKKIALILRSGPENASPCLSPCLVEYTGAGNANTIHALIKQFSEPTIITSFVFTSLGWKTRIPM